MSDSKQSFASAVADGEQKAPPSSSEGTGNPAKVGSSYGVSKEATTATGATVTPSYGNSANQSGPTGPAGGIMAGNQTTPGSTGGQSFGTAGYGDQVHAQGNSYSATSTPGGIPTAAQQALGGTQTGAQGAQESGVAPGSAGGNVGAASNKGLDLTKDAGPTPAEVREKDSK